MKNLLLLAAIAAGILFPFGHEFTFLIRYFLMVMLFFAFLEIKIEKGTIRRSHFIITAVVIITALSIYYIISHINKVLAETAFVTAIAPTAIAGPVIIDLINKKVEYITFSVILTNITIALLIPFILPVILHSHADISVVDVLLPMGTLLAIPFVLVQTIKRFASKIYTEAVKHKSFSYYFLVMNIYVGTSKAVDFISNGMTAALDLLIYIALITLAICAFYFSLGWFIGGKEFRREGSQSLGQKNNSFTIYIALAFMHPVNVLGPIFYVLIQNSYVTYELYRERHPKAK